MIQATNNNFFSALTLPLAQLESLTEKEWEFGIPSVNTQSLLGEEKPSDQSNLENLTKIAKLVNEAIRDY